jgi:hypothetical protein
MIRGRIGLLCGAAEQRIRNLLFGAVAAATVILFATVSLGFGTLAAYAYLSASEGRVNAALTVSAIYGLVAITIWVIWATRRRASCFRHAAAAPAPEVSGTSDLLIQSLAAAGPTQNQPALVAAMRLGRELTPMQLLALALIGGFVAARKIGK